MIGNLLPKDLFWRAHGSRRNQAVLFWMISWNCLPLLHLLVLLWFYQLTFKYSNKKCIVYTLSTTAIWGTLSSEACLWESSGSHYTLGFLLLFFWFYLFIYLFIWLRLVLVAALGLFVAAREIFLVVACGLLVVAFRDLVPWLGIEPRPPALGAWRL